MSVRPILAALLLCLTTAMVTWPAAGSDTVGQDGLLPEPEVDFDGLYVETWFEKAPLNLQTAAREAAAKGKALALIWEQPGCHYCREMHTVNLRIPQIADYLEKNFAIHQLNMRSDETVQDAEGAQVSQRRLAGRNGVRGTPTIQFLDADGTEVFRIPGYAKPAVFLAAFEFVAVKGYETASFRDWVKQKIARMQAQ